MDTGPYEDRPPVVVGSRAAAASKSDVGAVSRASRPKVTPGLASLDVGGTRGTQTPPGRRSTKRKNPAWRGVTEVREPSCGPGRCGAGDGAVVHSDLQPRQGIVAQASRIPAKIIGIVSWLPQEYVLPSRPLPRTASVTERDRSEPRHFIRTGGAVVVVLFRCGGRL